MKGLFITLEGPDGSGKSTITKKIVDYFKNKNIEILVTREPGGTEIGEKIRDTILDNANKAMVAETEALLYAASRAQHVHEKILPALKEGKLVLCERFILSSLAYQGLGRNLGVEEVKSINDFAIKGVRPDLTLFFSVDPALTLDRKVQNKGGDRLEAEGIDFHREVYDGYIKLITMYPENVQVIDASKDVDAVFAESIYYIEKLLKKRRNGK